jgi:mxaA protein
MWRAVLGLILLFVAATEARAQIRSVELQAPRPFGYFVGDAIHHEVDIVVDPGVDLIPGSLPQPGSLNFWLDLVASRVEESTLRHGKRYRLSLDYQNFYPALDARLLVIPGFSLSFLSGKRQLTAEVPAWSFYISPLREVLPAEKASGADYMRPDVVPNAADVSSVRVATFGFLALSLIVLALLAYHRAWWPFTRRAHRPFALAARDINRSLREGGDGKAYVDALLILHRAIDATAGQAVIAEDLPNFLERVPKFQRLQPEFIRFFLSSRDAFFAGNSKDAAADFPPSELGHFSEQLALVERAA